MSLVHKSSDDHKNLGKWPSLAHRESSTPLDVQYNTGWFTTGRDWWLVSWYSTDYQTRYCSTPNNFRAGIDSLEQNAGPIFFTAVSAAQKVSSYVGAVVEAATTAVSTVASVTGPEAFSEETTDGFKLHATLQRAGRAGQYLEVRCGYHHPPRTQTRLSGGRYLVAPGMSARVLAYFSLLFSVTAPTQYCYVDRTSRSVAPFVFASTARAPKSANTNTEACRPPQWHLVARPAAAADGTFHDVPRSMPVAPAAATAARSVRREAATVSPRSIPLPSSPPPASRHHCSTPHLSPAAVGILGYGMPDAPQHKPGCPYSSNSNCENWSKCELIAKTIKSGRAGVAAANAHTRYAQGSTPSPFLPGATGCSRPSHMRARLATTRWARQPRHLWPWGQARGSAANAIRGRKKRAQPRKATSLARGPAVTGFKSRPIDARHARVGPWAQRPQPRASRLHPFRQHPTLWRARERRQTGVWPGGRPAARVVAAGCPTACVSVSHA